ncbi:CobW/HypB/UreG, nucleotide-binding domain-containing protein [Haematococcus lacustris]
MMLSLKSLCVPCAAKCLRPVCSVPGRLPSARNVTIPSPPASSTYRHTLVAQPRPRASWHRAAATAAAGSAEAMNDPSVDNRIPVTVITGFLGSGKTTLLNNILTQNHGRRIAVIENEFGEIDIDSELVVKQEVVEGSRDTVMQLSNGCLCCTVRDDLIQALNRLYDRRSEFDHIVIETTGLANPAPIISSFFMDRSLPDKVKLDGVVTVVDAKHVSRHLDTPKEAGVVNEAVEQIAFADRILLNKTDLVDAASLGPLEARLQAINKMATITRAQRAQVEVDYVLGVGGFDLENVERELNITLQRAGHSHSHDHDHEHDHHHHDHDHTGPDCTHESHKHEHSHASSSHDHHHHDHDHTGPDCTHESHQHQHSHGQAALVEKHDDKVTSVSLLLEGDMDLDKVNYSLGLLLETRAEDIYRMKGLLSISGSDYRYVYQGVHQIFEGTPDRKWREGEKRCCKMVFIGRELDQEAFKEAFTFCLVKEAQPSAV